MSRRRGHGEGSIHRRSDGRWVAVVDVGWQNGKRRRKYVYGRTRREVADKLVQLHRDQDEGRVLVDARTTVAQFFTSWLQIVRPTLRPRTWTRYEQLVRRYVVARLGRVRLSKLEPQHLQALYAELLAAEEPLSPTTVLQLHRIIHRALGQAVRWGVAPRNVAALVDPPRKERYELAALTVEEAQRLLAAARDDRLEALYVLALTSGMRQGELLGLRWQDVDLPAGSVSVVRQLKTETSRRPVLLTRKGVAALRRHRAAQDAERRQAGTAWDDHDLVFSNTVGRPINPRNLLRRSFYPLLARAGLRRIRFHDLRHTTATLLLREGVHPKIVSELLGHSQIGITLNLYSHVTVSMQRAAVDTLGGLLGCQDGCQPEVQEGKPAAGARSSAG